MIDACKLVVCNSKIYLLQVNMKFDSRCYEQCVFDLDLKFSEFELGT